jgi:cyclohexa-1,5-dienecarbonyl-CoA hydratase
MADRQFIQAGREAGRFEVVLNRPPLNILHGPMMAEVAAAIDEAAADGDAKVLLIRAEGKAFSAGADIDEHRPGKAGAMIAQFHGMFRALEKVPYPTVAFVQGAALGGGCELALGCDVIVADPRAKFGQPEIGLGFLPPVAAAVLPGKVGWGRAMEICCSGRPLTAQEALSAGIVHRLLPEEGVQEALEDYLAPYLSQSPLILRLNKKALRGAGEKGFLQRLKVIERIFLEELMATEDVLEGLSSFDEKRAPAWKNR